MRKGILILILILFVVVVGWSFYKKSKSTTGADQTSGFKSFFPFGNSNSATEPDGTLSQNEPRTINTDGSTTNSPFKKITSHSVSGFTFFLSKTTLTTPTQNTKEKSKVETVIDKNIRYVSRTSGYVYEIKNGGTPIQVSNIYIPNIYEALFSPNGGSVILRFLRDDQRTIASYVVPVPDKNPDGTRTQKDGIYLPDSTLALDIAPDSTSIARVVPDGELTTLSSTTLANTGRKELYRGPFREWLVSWPTQKSVFLQTKASGTTVGFLYEVDSVNKRLSRILGDVQGLTTSVSPDGAYILYSESNKDSFTTKLLSTKTGSVKTLGLSVLPEKCVWTKSNDLICAGGNTPPGTYPDDWYAGIISFSDRIFRIYSGAGAFDVLYSGDEEFDMTNLRLDEETSTLYFINKKDASLWQFSF